jgi:RNA polymerase sigma-70 factor (ECF subfamily)
LLLFARQQTPVLADAEDIVQEAFVRFWRARGQDRSLTPGLMFTMIRRIAIDQARKSSGRIRTETTAAAGVETSDGWFVDPAESRERNEMIVDALRRLPQAQREVLVLKIWGGLTFEEISETLEVSANTAASRYRYALDHLRESLAPVVL